MPVSAVRFASKKKTPLKTPDQPSVHYSWLIEVKQN